MEFFTLETAFILLSTVVGLGVALFGWKKTNIWIFSAGVLFLMILPPLLLIILLPIGLLVFEKIGLMIFAFTVSLISITAYLYKTTKRVSFWSFPVVSILTGVGWSFVFTEYRLLDFIFFIGLGIGIAILGSGLYWRVYGLLISGCILLGVIPGVFFAWANPDDQNALVQTGVMLVWFALGWGLITVFARLRMQQFVWWPLIPGGIVAMVGWGLYIGGNPRSAVGFIGNTGSIALLIFGIYILLIRRGIHH